MNPATKIAVLLGGVDYDAGLWRTAVLANGGSVSPRTLKAVSNFCRQAKGLGLWSKLTRVNLICGDQLAAAQVPLKVGGGSATETLTNVVAGDYVETGATGGIKGNGTNKSLNTGWNPTTLSASTSSLGLWAYVRGTEAGGTSRTTIGCQATGAFLLLGWASSGTVEIGAIATATTTEFAPTGASAAKEGLLGITVNGDRSQQYYHNGAASGAPVTASGAYPNQPVVLLASNVNGTPNAFSTRYALGYALTTGMSATDAANLNTVMQTFQSALNRNV
jgi:hypothetical protein